MAEPSPDAVVQSLDSSYQQTKEAVAQCRRTSRIIAWVTVVVFLCYCYAIYGNLRSNWTEERMTTAATKEAKRLSPYVETAFTSMAEEVVPVYQELMAQKLDEAMPEIENKAVGAFDGATTKILTNVRKDIEVSIDRVLAKNEERLEREFPRMRTDDDFKALKHEWKQGIDQDVGGIVTHFVEKFYVDVADLQETLVLFKADDRFRFDDRNYVMRYFVHLWLSLLDRHILDMDFVENVDDRQ